jgi:hypothetical protein
MVCQLLDGTEETGRTKYQVGNACQMKERGMLETMDKNSFTVSIIFKYYFDGRSEDPVGLHVEAPHKR